MAAKTKKTLNDQNIKGLESAPKGKRYIAWDALQPFFGVIVTDNGSKTFGVSAKLPGETNTTFLRIGKVGAIGLAAARKTAVEWLRMISEDNKDPRTVVHAEEAELAKEVAADDRGRFCNVVTKFVAFKALTKKPHYVAQMKAYLETHCLPAWGGRHIKTITAEDIGVLVEQVCENNGSGASRALLSAIKTMSRWAAGKGIMTVSAAQLISPKEAIGEKVVRENPLTSEQLKKIWNAARLLGTPLGQIMRMLILTGCRLNEVAEGKWDEVDFKAKTWTIPKERMKMGKPHTIPLTEIMIEVLRSLKHGNADFMFSLNDGKSPYRVQSRAKGYVNDVVGFSGWVNHDLRHTMRTRVAELGVLPHVAEKMIAHTKKGYDHHDYKAEVCTGFELWHTEVARIVGWTPMIRRVA